MGLLLRQSKYVLYCVNRGAVSYSLWNRETRRWFDARQSECSKGSSRWSWCSQAREAPNCRPDACGIVGNKSQRYQIWNGKIQGNHQVCWARIEKCKWVLNFLSCVAAVNGSGESARKRRGGKGKEGLLYKNRAIVIRPTDFLVIELHVCQLSIRLQIRNAHPLLRMAVFTREFTMFTSQRELASRNFATASVRRNEQNWVFIAGAFPSLPSSPLPEADYAGYEFILRY